MAPPEAAGRLLEQQAAAGPRELHATIDFALAEANERPLAGEIVSIAVSGERLNLHALPGAQRADVGSIRAIWIVWNPSRSIPAKEFEFTDCAVARIEAAIETWNSYGVTLDWSANPPLNS